MTLAEEKEALKKKLLEIGNRKKKAPKYKKEPKDILNDPKSKFFFQLNIPIDPTCDSPEEREARN